MGGDASGRSVSCKSSDATEALAQCIRDAVNFLPQRPLLSSWVVGPEYSGPHFAKLGAALRKLGYAPSQPHTVVGGSQEITSWVAIGTRSHLLIEAETYCGLVVSGLDSDVEDLRHVYEIPGA